MTGGTLGAVDLVATDEGRHDARLLDRPRATADGVPDEVVTGLDGNSIAITSGLSRGDRIAAAGVHVLNEGQQVRLLASDS